MHVYGYLFIKADFTSAHPPFLDVGKNMCLKYVCLYVLEPVKTNCRYKPEWLIGTSRYWDVDLWFVL